MPDEYDDLPIAEADRLLREEIEQHRNAMGERGRRRARRVAAEVQKRGQGAVAQLAEELGLSESAIRRLLAEARRPTKE